jgi:hypothetical protein
MCDRQLKRSWMLSPVGNDRKSSHTVAWMSVSHPNGPMPSICVTKLLTYFVPVEGATYTCTTGAIEVYIFEISKRVILAAAPQEHEINRIIYTPHEMRTLKFSPNIGTHSPRLAALDRESHKFDSTSSGTSSSKQVTYINPDQVRANKRAYDLKHAALHKAGIRH